VPEGSENAIDPMYCPGCEQMVPEHFDLTDERFRCEECGSGLYEDKEEYIQVTHATARWEKENGYGAFHPSNGGGSSV